MEKTNAMRILDRAGIPYTVREYAGTGLSGAQVAELLGEDPSLVYKTLVTISGTKKYYVFALPVRKELDLKKAAAAAGEKSLSMLPQKELFPLTGYLHGGCSPIGMKKNFPTFFQQDAQEKTIFLSGGRIGVQIRADFTQLNRVFGFQLGDFVRE